MKPKATCRGGFGTHAPTFWHSARVRQQNACFASRPLYTSGGGRPKTEGSLRKEPRQKAGSAASKLAQSNFTASFFAPGVIAQWASHVSTRKHMRPLCRFASNLRTPSATMERPHAVLFR